MLKYILPKSHRHDYVLLLNDDLVIDRTYVSRLVNHMLKKQKTLIGSVVTNIKQRNVIENGGVVINWWTAKARVLNRGKDINEFPKLYYENVSYLTGRGVIFPVKAFQTLGLYKEEHYQQCGDPEFPVRAAKSGYNLIVTYDTPVHSYVEDKGHINHNVNYTSRDIKRYFFNIRSNTRIKYRFWFAIDSSRNCLQGTSFLIFAQRFTMHNL